MAELGISWPASCLGVDAALRRRAPLALKGVLQGYVATIQWMRDNRERALDLLQRFTESNDRALVEEAYETTLKYQQPVPYPPPEGVRTILSTIGTENAAALPPERFIEDRALRELDASGFVRSLAP